MESVSNVELQIGSRDSDNNVTSIFLESGSSIAVAVWSTYGSEINVNFEVRALPTYKGTVQAC